MRPFATLLLFTLATASLADAPSAAERGKHNITQKNYNPAVWSLASYSNVWKRWDGVSAKPDNYDEAFRQYYGLHAAPYPNHNLPMGLRQGNRLLGKGLSIDCLVCHGGSIMGQSYVGLGNSTHDLQALFEDLAQVDGLPYRTPFAFTQVRGTSEAGAMAVYLLGRRTPELAFKTPAIDLGLHDDLCEDAPAWWLLKKKKTMYWNGGADSRSVRSIMQFMMSPLNGPGAFAAAEADFADIREFFLSLESPRYPLAIDAQLATVGKTKFVANCSRCHGTYGPDGNYPNKVIPIDEIGTDRRRYDGIEDRFGVYYNESWFAKESPQAYPAVKTAGYQAPPLDGIWATAPYFHNGSVPTIYHVLNSKTRPARYTRSYRTDLSDYDPIRLGWKVTPVGEAERPRSAIERRRVYNTAQPGRANSGHFYGDDLTEGDRMAIIEYLKTL